MMAVFVSAVALPCSEHAFAWAESPSRPEAATLAWMSGLAATLAKSGRLTAAEESGSLGGYIPAGLRQFSWHTTVYSRSRSSA